MLASAPKYEELTKGLSTKSDKIRALAKQGVPTADIARYLDIKYQHARNVLVDCGLHQPKLAQAPAAAAAAVPEKRVWATLDKAGGLVIPAEMLRQAGLAPGGRVFVGITSEGVELLSQKAALNRAHEIARKYIKPGSNIVDDFIAERRAEARREDEKYA